MISSWPLSSAAATTKAVTTLTPESRHCLEKMSQMLLVQQVIVAWTKTRAAVAAHKLRHNAAAVRGALWLAQHRHRQHSPRAREPAHSTQKRLSTVCTHQNYPGHSTISLSSSAYSLRKPCAQQGHSFGSLLPEKTCFEQRQLRPLCCESCNPLMLQGIATLQRA